MGEESKLKHFFSKIANFLSHNMLFQWVIQLAFKLRIADVVVRMVGEADGTVKRYGTYDEQHREEYKKLSSIFADEMSRETLDKVLEYRRTEKVGALKGIVVKNEYFLKDIFTPQKDEIFVDGGAFTGDTVKEFVDSFMGGGYIL